MASYYDSLRTYNVYDAIRARARARRQASKLEQAVVDQATGEEIVGKAPESTEGAAAE